MGKPCIGGLMSCWRSVPATGLGSTRGYFFKMRMQSCQRYSRTILALMSMTLGAWGQSATEVHVVDSVTGKAVPDATVTLNGAVVAVDARGDYSVPAGAQVVMARAPGYRAVTLPVGDLTKQGGKLELTPFAVKGLYLSEYGIESNSIRDSALGIIRAGGANALVINIKSDHGFLIYPSEIPLAKSVGARSVTTVKSLPQLMQNGHAQGIYMIARIVTFKDNPLATSRPELALHLANGSLFKDGEHLGWTDPYRPEVRAYNIAIAVEAAKAGFDEIQFDYVRFPDAASKLRVSGPTDEPGRVKAITDFLKQAKAALVPYNVFMSADIFGYVAWNSNDTGIGQQLDAVMKVVDYACPMLYPSGFKYGIPGHPKPMATNVDIYNTIKLTLDNAVRRTNANPKKFRPWLQAFRDYAFNRLVYGPEQVAAQTRAAADVGTDGWLLWNPHNRYSDIGLGHAAAQTATEAAR